MRRGNNIGENLGVTLTHVYVYISMCTWIYIQYRGGIDRFDFSLYLILY